MNKWNFKKILCVWVFCKHVCQYHKHEAPWRPEVGLGSLELELWAVLWCWEEPGSSGRVSSAFNHWAASGFALIPCLISLMILLSALLIVLVIYSTLLFNLAYVNFSYLTFLFLFSQNLYWLTGVLFYFAFFSYMTKVFGHFAYFLLCATVFPPGAVLIFSLSHLCVYILFEDIDHFLLNLERSSGIPHIQPEFIRGLVIFKGVLLPFPFRFFCCLCCSLCYSWFGYLALPLFGDLVSSLLWWVLLIPSST